MCLWNSKFLGVIIDEILTWKNHIDGISKTIFRNMGMLCKLRHNVPGYILYFSYCTLVIQHINYESLIFGNTYKLKKLDRTISLELYRSHTGQFLNLNFKVPVLKNWNFEVQI